MYLSGNVSVVYLAMLVLFSILVSFALLPRALNHTGQSNLVLLPPPYVQEPSGALIRVLGCLASPFAASGP